MANLNLSTADLLNYASGIAARFEKQGSPITPVAAIEKAESAIAHARAYLAIAEDLEPDAAHIAISQLKEREFDPEATITAARMVQV